MTSWRRRDLGAEVRSVLGEKLGGSVIAEGAVLADEVAEDLVGGDGGQDVGRAAEVFQSEELGFDGGVAAFDIGVEGRVGTGAARQWR